MPRGARRSQPGLTRVDTLDRLSDESPTPTQERPPLPPAGWFVDPEQPGRLRWWDGERWTEHRTDDPDAPIARPQDWRTSSDGSGSASAKTSGWAIASLVFGVIGGILLAIVFGFVARRKIRDSGGKLTGEAMANVGIGLGVVWAIVLAIAIGEGALSSSSNTDRYKGQDKPIAALVDHVEKAFADNSGDRACRQLFTETFAQRVATGSGKTCSTFVVDAVADGEFQAQIKIKSIDVTGNSARVDVTEGGDPQIWSLERVGNAWRVDDIAA